MKRDIFTVTRRIRHHTARSGYDLLAEYVGHPVEVPQLLSKLRGFGWLHRYARKKSGMEWYDALFVELYTAWHMRRRPDAIYHFLFAENDFRFLFHFTSKQRHKIVCTFHSTPNEFEKVMGQTDHLRHIDFAIAVATNQKQMLETRFGSKRVTVIPHGVDTTHFTPSKEHTENGVCLCVGHHHRDLNLLCNVAEILKRENPEIQVILVDRVFSVYRTLKEQKIYRERFDSLGNIELKTDISDAELLRLYRTSDLLLLPLLDTTANVALLEGISCGLPVVVTDVGGIRDYVEANCALFAPRGDAKKMSEQVLTILKDRPLRGTMSEAARKQALLFDWKRIAEQLQNVYGAL